MSKSSIPSLLTAAIALTALTAASERASAAPYGWQRKPTFHEFICPITPKGNFDEKIAVLKVFPRTGKVLYAEMSRFDYDFHWLDAPDEVQNESGVFLDADVSTHLEAAPLARRLRFWLRSKRNLPRGPYHLWRDYTVEVSRPDLVEGVLFLRADSGGLERATFTGTVHPRFSGQPLTGTFELICHTPNSGDTRLFRRGNH